MSFSGRRFRTRSIFIRASILPVALWVCTTGCGGATKSVPKGSRGDKKILELCDGNSSNTEFVDLNADARPDARKVHEGGRLRCAEYDLNFDGKMDVTRFYAADGKTVLREQHDFDMDGKVDHIAYYGSGVLERKELDTNFDNSIDTWMWCKGPEVLKVERDKNRDGNPDVWEEYKEGLMSNIRYDDNKDGKADRWDFYEGGRLAQTAIDQDKDGKPDNIKPLPEGTFVGSSADVLSCDDTQKKK